MTLTRDVTSSSYGAYTVTFTQNGFDTTNSTIPTGISPMGTTGQTSGSSGSGGTGS
jgi:hypothetical protein